MSERGEGGESGGGVEVSACGVSCEFSANSSGAESWGGVVEEKGLLLTHVILHNYEHTFSDSKQIHDFQIHGPYAYLAATLLGSLQDSEDAAITHGNTVRG